jgi:nucleoid-associated protein YgaU
MHSIERYGIVALLFLVVTVVAVLMWDGGKKKKPEEVVGQNPAPVVDAPAPRALDRENRLSLVAPGKPGPLVRKLDGNEGASTPGAEPASADGSAVLRDQASSQPLTQPSAGDTESAFLRADERPAPPERPLAAESAALTRPYVVKSGDTLSEIAQRELGSSRRWQEIIALNPGLDPARLRSGKSIQLPGGERTVASGGGAPRSVPVADAPRKEPVAASTRTHKVGKGENLWKIAARTLGDGKRWKEIATLNPGVNPDRLVLGQVLKLPAASGAAQPSGATQVAATKKAKPSESLVAVASERPARRGGKVK